MDYDILFIFGSNGLEKHTLPITQNDPNGDGLDGKLANTRHNK
jgi:hypothetical protein